MHVLTVSAPYAWLLIAGAKPVENRSWAPTVAPGTAIALHVGKAPDRMAVASQALLRVRARVTANLALSPLDEDRRLAHVLRATWAARGALLGTVVLTSAHQAASLDCGCPPLWAQPGRWHWRLTPTRVLEDPIPWAGQLGLVNRPHVDELLSGAPSLPPPSFPNGTPRSPRRRTR